MSKFNIPTNLSFTGSLEPGLGFMSAILEDGSVVPVTVEVAKIKGTMANYKEVKDLSDPGKAEKALNAGRANLQAIDQAVMPVGSKTLKVEFSLSVKPASKNVHASNCITSATQLNELVSAYAQKGGFAVIAERYVANALRGAWLWRNAATYPTGRIEIEVVIDGVSRVFSNEVISAESFLKAPKGSEDLVAFVAKVLSGQHTQEETGFSLATSLKVTAYIDASQGQLVFPSQEFVDKGDTDLSRVLGSVKVAGGVRQAILHSQKIGNALRRIDDWYTPIQGFALRPLPVEPLGVDSTYSVAHRASQKEDFFTLIEKKYDALMTSLNAAQNATQIPNELHYIVATLIRGGVFGGKN
jgi:CRISPR-associated protein Csy3